jgi:hypothetical protein
MTQKPSPAREVLYQERIPVQSFVTSATTRLYRNSKAAEEEKRAKSGARELPTKTDWIPMKFQATAAYKLHRNLSRTQTKEIQATVNIHRRQTTKETGMKPKGR